MRKIILLEFMSLDGVIQAPGGTTEDPSEGFKYGGWTVPYDDDMGSQIMEKQMSGEYDLLLGRKTYDIWAAYWPSHAENWPQVNNITKYVASTSLTNPEWENTVVIKNIEELKKLKESEGSPLQVYGSSILAQALLTHDLVDEMWLKIYPVTLGSGKKLFEAGTIPAAFTLTESQVTPKGVIIASYKRAGEVETGSFV